MPRPALLQGFPEQRERTLGDNDWGGERDLLVVPTMGRASRGHADISGVEELVAALGQHRERLAVIAAVTSPALRVPSVKRGSDASGGDVVHVAGDAHLR